VTVADLKTLWVLADVYERDLARAREGDQAEVRVGAYPGEVFPGVVKHVGEVVDPTSRTVKVRVVVQNPNGLLKPEMFAKVTLTRKAGEPSLNIPASAVLSDGEKTTVIVSANNSYRQRPVEVGPERDGKVRVLSGLQPGETIVVEGALFVKAELQKN
jgi:cobalt-zinc-cadmium efflux system membrane fusion protein